MSRNQEQQHVTYDHDLGIEAYQLSVVVQKFPNHFHDFYVIGFIEGRQRHLWCKGQEYDLRPGDLILFNLWDNHYCSSICEELLDYRVLNIKPEVMLKAAKKITGKDYAPALRKMWSAKARPLFRWERCMTLFWRTRPGFRKKKRSSICWSRVCWNMSFPLRALKPQSRMNS